MNDQIIFNKLINCKIPQPYVHPRLIFAKEDVDIVLEKINANEYSAKKFVTFGSVLENTTKKEGTGEYILFEKLANGNTDDLIFDKMNMFKNVELSTNWGTMHFGGILGIISCDALYALLTKDDERLKFLAKVAGNYIKFIIPLVEEHSKTEEGKRLYRGYHSIIGNQAIGYVYDFLYNQMSEEARADYRNIIKVSTYGKNTYGMEFPRHFNNNNWVPCDSEYGLNILAIEGEEGYYDYGYKKMCEMFSDYFEYGVSNEGVLRESIGKASWLHRYSTFMYVALKRGDLHLPLSRVNKLLKYHAQCIEPFGKSFMNHGDAAPANMDIVMAMFYKLMVPENKCVDYIIKNVMRDEYYQENPLSYRVEIYGIADLLFSCDYDKKIERKDLDIPLSLIDVDDYGTVITRSDDSEDALYMQFEARCDHRHVGHHHNDAGNFTLSALGRAWGCESPGMKKSGAYHSIVQIDGKSQGNNMFFCPNVIFQKASDNEAATLGSADIKYAYDYIWGGPHHYFWYTPEKKLFKWELETKPEVLEFFEEYNKGNYQGRIWGGCTEEVGQTMRAMYNPVKYAYRTAGIIRGKHPFALIVDDINKDNKEHLYEWFMQMPIDLDIIWADGYDIIIGESTDRTPQHNFAGSEPIFKQGQRLMLIRILDMNELSDYTRCDETVPFKVETLYKQVPCNMKFKEQLIKRFNIATRAIDPKFKIMLYPFRYGEELPETAWNDDETELNIKCGDENRIISFVTDDSNQTQLEVMRF